ncbi:MAG: AraC family transcriptional regulator [Spirochaetaceae bacterium]|jgi:AraC-like DNA-binding protein|nr:AraC family transcriptional regulator [Spirochaetaceae bacterium]
MLYSLLPVNDRVILETNLMIYVNPEKHPTRLMDFHDLFFQVAGRWNVFLEDEEIQMNPGDIAFLPAGHHHYGDTKCIPNTRTLFIHFEARKEDHAVNIEDKQNLLIESFIQSKDSRIFGFFQEMLKIYKSNSPFRELYGSALLSMILIELSKPHLQMAIKRDRLITEILDILSYNTNKFFSIQELANEAGISPRSLSSRFRAETGWSIHSYQMNSKLDQIAAILRNNSYASLKNLAFNFGFYDEFHLSSAFKHKFGMSPKNYSKTSLETADKITSDFSP